MTSNAEGENVSDRVRLNHEQIVSKANTYFTEFRDALSEKIGMLGDHVFSDYIDDDVLKLTFLPPHLNPAHKDYTSDYKYKFRSIVELKSMTDEAMTTLSDSLEYSQEQIFSRNLIVPCSFSINIDTAKLEERIYGLCYNFVYRLHILERENALIEEYILDASPEQLREIIPLLQTRVPLFESNEDIEDHLSELLLDVELLGIAEDNPELFEKLTRIFTRRIRFLESSVKKNMNKESLRLHALGIYSNDDIEGFINHFKEIAVYYLPYASDDRDKKILECLSKLQTNQHFIPEEADDKIKNSKWLLEEYKKLSNHINMSEEGIIYYYLAEEANKGGGNSYYYSRMYPLPTPYLKFIEDRRGILYDIEYLIPHISADINVDEIITKWQETNPAFDRATSNADLRRRTNAFHVHNVSRLLAEKPQWKRLQFVVDELKLKLPFLRSDLQLEMYLNDGDRVFAKPEQIQTETIYQVLNGMLAFVYDDSPEYHTELAKLNRILKYERSGKYIEFPGDLVQNKGIILNSLLFLLMMKDKTSIESYFSQYLLDCTQAYSTGNPISCVKGRFERLYTTFINIISTMGESPEEFNPSVETSSLQQEQIKSLKEKYLKLIEFIKGKSIDPNTFNFLMRQYFDEWLQYRPDPNAANQTNAVLSMNKEGRKANAKEYIIQKMMETTNIYEDQDNMRVLDNFLNTMDNEFGKPIEPDNAEDYGRRSMFLGGKKKKKKKRTKRHKTKNTKTRKKI